MAGFWDSFSQGYQNSPKGFNRGIELGMREAAANRLAENERQNALAMQEIRMQDQAKRREERKADTLEERAWKEKLFDKKLGYDRNKEQARLEEKNRPRQLKDLGSEDKKRYDSAKMALNGVLGMGASLDMGHKTYSIVGDNPFTIAERNFTEGLGRMQSGGAINADENKRFRDMAPKLLDTKETREYKLQQLQKELKSRMATLGFKDLYQDDYSSEGMPKPSKSSFNETLGVIGNIFMPEKEKLPISNVAGQPMQRQKMQQMERLPLPRQPIQQAQKVNMITIKIPREDIQAIQEARKDGFNVEVQ